MGSPISNYPAGGMCGERREPLNPTKRKWFTLLIGGQLCDPSLQISCVQIWTWPEFILLWRETRTAQSAREEILRTCDTALAAGPIVERQNSQDLAPLLLSNPLLPDLEMVRTHASMARVKNYLFRQEEVLHTFVGNQRCGPSLKGRTQDLASVAVLPC